MEKARSARGEGSFYRDEKRGLYVAEFDLGVGPNGKRRRRKVTAKSQGDLSRKLFDLRVEGGGVVVPRAAGNVGEFVDQWLKQDVEPYRARATYLSYEGVWRKHVQPSLGAVKFEKLTVEHVNALYRKLRADGVSASMSARVGRVMHRAIAVAIRSGQYHRPNPFGIVEKPRAESAETTVFDPAQASAFLLAARHTDDRYEALFAILVTAGLRIGEALALRWSDIDLDKRTIAIRRSLSQAGGKHAFRPPKTKGSRRSVAYGALVAAALKRRKAAHDAEGHGSELVFCTPTGGKVWTYDVRAKHFYPLLKRADLPRIRLQDLRHTMTSIGLAEGTNLKVLAERLGHSTTKLTSDRYSHVLPGQQRAATNAIDAALGRKPRR